tara:strand:- start:35664 stop:35963 length:300 start_codon:yes stop_codon:yes gene_type:complete
MNNYRTTCSCCGFTVSKEARELPDNDESEGNLCMSCYQEQSLDAWFEMHETFDMVYKAMSNPIAKLKWRYWSDAFRWYTCLKLMDRGILKYQIGGSYGS